MSKSFPSLHMSRNEMDNIILQNLLICGTNNIGTLESQIMNRREKILCNHIAHRSIWQNKTTGKWCTKLGEQKHLIMRRNKEDLENAIIEFYINNQTDMATFSDMFYSFIKYAADNNIVSGKTIVEYENEFNKYIKPTELASTPIVKITEMQLAKTLRYMVHIIKLSNKRYSNVKTVIRKTFNHARLEHGLACITVDSILNDTKFSSSEYVNIIRNEEEEVFKLSEIKKIKQHLEGTNNLEELAILLDIETGLRLSEIVALQKEDINLSKNKIHVCHAEHKSRQDGKFIYYIGLPKKNKVADVQLTQEAKLIVEKIISMSDSIYLFPDANDSNTWNKSYNIDKTIRRICREVDIPVRSLQKIRRFYASALLQVYNLPLKTVQKQLRHSDETTTLKHYSYNILDVNELEEVFINLKI